MTKKKIKKAKVAKKSKAANKPGRKIGSTNKPKVKSKPGRPAKKVETRGRKKGSKNKPKVLAVAEVAKFVTVENVTSTSLTSFSFTPTFAQAVAISWKAEEVAVKAPKFSKERLEQMDDYEDVRKERAQKEEAVAQPEEKKRRGPKPGSKRNAKVAEVVEETKAETIARDFEKTPPVVKETVIIDVASVPVATVVPEVKVEAKENNVAGGIVAQISYNVNPEKAAQEIEIAKKLLRAATRLNNDLSPTMAKTAIANLASRVSKQAANELIEEFKADEIFGVKKLTIVKTLSI